LKPLLKQVQKFNNFIVTALFLITIAAVMAGCSESEKTPGTAIPKTQVLAQPIVSKPTATVTEEKPRPVFAYNPAGRRDPFAPLIVKQEKTSKLGDRPPLERYNLYEFKMMGVLWGGFGYNAMLEGPDGKGYFVRVGTVIGPNKGVVKKITQSSVIVEEKFKSISGAPERKETVIELRKKQEEIQ